MKNKNIDIYQIAEEAGVSKSTVSRVINNKAGVKDSTRNKVLKVIKDLNYKPNSSAKGLASKKTNTIGLAISDITDPFFALFVKGAETKAMEANYNMMLANSHWVVEEELKCIQMFEEGRVDGILMISGGSEKRLNNYLNNLASHNLQIVVVDRKIDNDKIPKLKADNLDAGYRAAKYLIDLGHNKIAHIKGEDVASSDASRDRVRGYKKALAEAGIKEKIIYPGYFSRIEAERATKKLLQEHPEVTAIFYSSDMMAIGGLKAIKNMGLKIPEDISIIGVDGIEMAALMDPPITTMAQPSFEMGYQGMEKLIKKLEAEAVNSHNQDIIFKMKLIERASTSSLS
ncbi:LacI family transcriptional regulator [Halanaerobium saccharolyticum]|uniref:LacI family transcriptional regulator n=2 Tax=Halanaerobium saccharolyticum TaxID=43595 RepID=A0A4R6LHM1_9FIRM|nr:LacI family DNA-binding transcriptional regulator [Halanaerobium saccharolyticum]TDO83372.1 LacI family transcriptional regulator [Halanaerobium saccharolyticum]